MLDQHVFPIAELLMLYPDYFDRFKTFDQKTAAAFEIVISSDLIHKSLQGNDSERHFEEVRDEIMKIAKGGEKVLQARVEAWLKSK